MPMTIRYSAVSGSLLIALVSSPAYSSGLLSSATINPVGPCSASQTVTGTSSAFLNLCSSSASANTSFDISSPTLGTLAISDSVAPTIEATSTASFDFPLYVSGGSGLGFLALDFVSTTNGQNDAMASASAKIDAALNGSVYSSTIICANVPAVGGNFSCSGSQSIGFGFVYGVPFELSVSLTGRAGSGPTPLIIPTDISTSGDFSYGIYLSGTALVPNPNGKLNLVPEPSSAALVISGMLLSITIWRLRRTA